VATKLKIPRSLSSLLAYRYLGKNKRKRSTFFGTDYGNFIQLYWKQFSLNQNFHCL